MDFIQLMEQLKQNPAIVEQLASSPDGQALMARLDANQLQHATQQGENGNYMEMAALLKKVMSSPDGKALLQRMAKQLDK